MPCCLYRDAFEHTNEHDGNTPGYRDTSGYPKHRSCCCGGGKDSLVEAKDRQFYKGEANVVYQSVGVERFEIE